jgi:hypothetical protein
MKFRLNKTLVLRNLFLAVGFLLIGNILSVFLLFNTGVIDNRFVRLLIKLFNFDSEANLPTYFSSLLLLSNGILLALIGIRYKALGQKFWGWFGLSIIFMFLALDEMIQIHEQLDAPMKAFFNTSGLLYYAWVIPYVIITIIIAIANFKFMMRLPKLILKYFIVAGILFVGGAVGMEVLSGIHLEKYGNKTLTNALIYSFEELLEMSGSVVFLYALVSYIQLKFNTFLITFGTHEGDTKD